MQWINQTLLDLLGYSREEVTGRSVEHLLGIGSRIFYQTHWFPLLRLHGRAEEVFLLLRSRAGEDLGMLTNAQGRETTRGVVYDCVLMHVRERQKYESELLRARREAERVRDELQHLNEQLAAQAGEMELQQQQLQEQAADLRTRTEEAERLREEAEQANEAKSSFLAVMSHELRTPLNAIAGYLDLLLLGVHGPLSTVQQETLEKIARSGRHLLRLINEVLNLARIEAGHVDYVLEDVPVSTLVEEVLPLIQPQLASKQLTLSTEVPPALRVHADQEKTQQVLLNLLSNAGKFTPSGGHIHLEAHFEAARGQVCLQVRDTGIGIPPSKLESIFQPFVQVDTSRTRTAEGTGLGLAISRDLARGMGGDLLARSAPGEGSVFSLLLPRARHVEEPRGMESESLRGPAA